MLYPRRKHQSTAFGMLESLCSVLPIILLDLLEACFDQFSLTPWKLESPPSWNFPSNFSGILILKEVGHNQMLFLGVTLSIYSISLQTNINKMHNWLHHVHGSCKNKEMETSKRYKSNSFGEIFSSHAAIHIRLWKSQISAACNYATITLIFVDLTNHTHLHFKFLQDFVSWIQAK